MYRKLDQLDFKCPDVIRFGRGTVAETAKYVGDSDATVLIVTDPGIIEAGLVDSVESSLKESGISYKIFSGVKPDPTVSNVEKCLERAREIGADALVGVGGGSPMDVTKATSVLLTNDCPIDELFGRDNVSNQGITTVLLPTTTGTGSEVSPGSVFYDDRPTGSGEKEAILDPSIYPKAALIDPDLSMHLPSPTTRATGLDAFTHAIGSFISKEGNSFADALCLEAMTLIEENLRDAAFHGAEAPEAREKMAIAATMAMVGRTNGGKAAVHSLAYGIQGMYDVPHGKAIAMVLPEVIEYNLPAAVDRFARLGTRLYDATGGQRERAHQLVEGVYRLRDDLDLDEKLTNVGAAEGEMDDLVDLATHSQRHLDPNPRHIDREDAEIIFRKIWE
mgnify:CR=1 FL=1